MRRRLRSFLVTRESSRGFNEMRKRMRRCEGRADAHIVRARRQSKRHPLGRQAARKARATPRPNANPPEAARRLALQLLLLATGARRRRVHLEQRGNSGRRRRERLRRGFDSVRAERQRRPHPGIDAGVDASSDSGLDTGLDGAATGTLGTTTVDFGLVSCGTGTGSQTYSFKNTGPVPVDYAATIAAGAVFSIDGVSSGTVAPGANGIDHARRGLGDPDDVDRGNALHGDSLIADHERPRLRVGHRAALGDTARGLAHGVAGAGRVRSGATRHRRHPDSAHHRQRRQRPGHDHHRRPLHPRRRPHRGHRVRHRRTQAPPRGCPPRGGGIVRRRRRRCRDVPRPPHAAGLKSVTASTQTTDPLCASPATADRHERHRHRGPGHRRPRPPRQFGTTLCGQTAAPLQVTLKELVSCGREAFTDALGLGAASPFTIDLAAGSIPGGTSAHPGKAVIPVTPKKIAIPASVVAGAFNDTLVVTPTAPGLTPTSNCPPAVRLRAPTSPSPWPAPQFAHPPQSAQGTPLHRDQLRQPRRPASSSPPAELRVLRRLHRNVPPLPPLAAKGPRRATSPSTPSANGADNGTLTVTTSAALCAATPAPISLTATGAVPVAQATAPPPSRSPPHLRRRRWLRRGASPSSNSGSPAPLTITSVTSKSGYFTFTNPGTIAVGRQRPSITAHRVGRSPPGAGPTRRLHTQRHPQLHHQRSRQPHHHRPRHRRRQRSQPRVLRRRHGDAHHLRRRLQPSLIRFTNTGNMAGYS